MTLQQLREKSAALPAAPGVYIMKNADGKIIYVGKSKKLKNRVHQYFTALSSHTPKVRRMVQNVDDFEYILAPSESEALLLENNLIKLHRPKYNILLKDDKTYPYLVFDTTAAYPRLSLARRRLADGRTYFGPFENGSTVREIKKQAEQLFLLPSCRKAFPASFGKERPCLQYHLGHCCGVCRGNISEEEYQKKVALALSFLKGDYKKVLRDMTAEMEDLAEKQEFEKAAVLRDRIKSIAKLGEGRIMVLAPDIDCDAVGIRQRGDDICIALLTIRKGRICRQDRHFLQDTGMEENPLFAFLPQYYMQNKDIPPAVFISQTSEEAQSVSAFLAKLRGSKVYLHQPSRGKNKELVDLALKNADEGLDMQQTERDKEHRKSVELAEFLGQKTPIRRIEMYDISQFGEDNLVGGMIVWQNGRLQKNLFRRFRIKGQKLPDDYRATAEVITRRIERLHTDPQKFAPAPDLILLDGGKGHVSTLYPLIRDALPECMVLGLVKDGRHRTRALVDAEGNERGFAGDPKWFSFFSALQDEVHRYTIEYMHSSKRKDMLRSELCGINGLGDKRYQKLMRHFKTKKALSEASMEQLIALGLPRPAAAAVHDYFHPKEETT